MDLNPFEKKVAPELKPGNQDGQEGRQYDTIEELIIDRSLAELANDACLFLRGEPEAGYMGLSGAEDIGEQRTNAMIEWLRWIQCDSHLARMKWICFVEGNENLEKTEKLSDRDGYVAEFFNVCQKDEYLKEYSKRFWSNWSYYQNHFFYWFLNRYNLPFAIGTFSGSRLLQWLPVYGSIVATALVWFFIYFSWFNPRPFANLAYVLFVMLIGYAWGLARLQALPGFKLLHAMVPRLAGTTAIGYLYLLSVPQFLAYLCRQGADVGLQWGTGAVILLLVFVFTCIQIQKRVKPDLTLPRLGGRAFQMIVIAMAYSSTGLCLTRGFLFQNALPTGGFDDLGPGASQLFLVAVISLAIGVVLQLVWEEKPVTEPL